MINHSKIENALVGWSDSLIMVCTKCGNQFNNSSGTEAPDRIKSELKIKTKQEFGEAIRVISTSCLNICPKNKIAIAVARKKTDKVFEAFAVDPDIACEELFEKIFKE